METNKHIKSCPIELVVKLISKKWVIQIIRDLFLGKTRFHEFKEDKPNLSNKVLSNCLKDMEKNGLIHRIADRYDRKKVRYKLSEYDSPSTLTIAISYSILFNDFPFSVNLYLTFFLSYRSAIR